MATTTDDPTTTPEPVQYRVTPQVYLLRERAAKYKSEYFDGEVVSMAGAPEPHVTVSGNVFAHLYMRLRPPCRAWQSELKVQVDGAKKGGKSYVYPDVLVVCGTPQFIDPVRDTLTNPIVVFEVLSPSTERKDRTRKARAYQRIESLAAYVFVSQKEPRVEVYARAADGSWPCTVFQGLGDTVPLGPIGCTLTLAEIFKDFVWPAAKAGPEVRGSSGSKR